MDQIFSRSPEPIAQPDIEDLLKLKGDKYSHNFGRFLRRWVDRGTKESRNGRTGIPLVFIADEDDSTPFLGWMEDGEFFGIQIGRVLFEGNSPNYWGDFVYNDVDNSFWQRYIDTGICAIDTKHVHDYPNRWERLDDNTRKCRFCGNVTQHRHVTYTVRETQHWLPTSATNPEQEVNLLVDTMATMADLRERILRMNWRQHVHDAELELALDRAHQLSLRIDPMALDSRRRQDAIMQPVVPQLPHA